MTLTSGVSTLSARHCQVAWPAGLTHDRCRRRDRSRQEEETLGAAYGSLARSFRNFAHQTFGIGTMTQEPERWIRHSSRVYRCRFE
jgi:hypothetical protein